MSRTNTLIVLGVLIMLMPFSGLPIAIRSLGTILFGVGVLAIGLSLRAGDVRASEKKDAAPKVPEEEPSPVMDAEPAAVPEVSEEEPQHPHLSIG